MRRHGAFRALFAALALAGAARAADYYADPGNVTTALTQLQPGDTLHLDGGTYAPIVLSNLNGTPCDWITVTGPTSGNPATFVADPTCGCNTVELVDSSYLALMHVTVEGNHIADQDGIKAGGVGNFVHDIRIEGCTIQNCDGDQQTDGISTKTPTWGWIIRGNVLTNIGTALYLGNSDGTDPFVAGVVEDNLVVDPIGYDMEIKEQFSWAAYNSGFPPGLPPGPHSTVIRNNVFIKGPLSPLGSPRPNVLTDNYPSCGPGSSDRYEIYGNVFFHNGDGQPLLQVSGNVTIHDNLFVDSNFAAIDVQLHSNTDPSGVAIPSPVIQPFIYDNTIYTSSPGVVFENAATGTDAVAGNAIFSTNAIMGPVVNQWDNVVDTVANAGNYVATPSMTLGAFDFHPLAGQLQGAPLDAGFFAADLDPTLDFDGNARGAFTARGAYATSGPGWVPDASIKPVTFPNPSCVGFDGGQVNECGYAPCDGGPGCVGGDAGPPMDGGTNASDSGLPAGDAGGNVDGGTGTARGGCHCGAGPGDALAALLVALGAGTRLGRRRSTLGRLGDQAVQQRVRLTRR